jgi:DNA-binding MarR family transcriptional regulator/ribosomal protein S18 acetylase RimI-like enzyme
MATATADDIAAVRSFNRLVTSQIGALNERYLGRRPLGELRVLFEIGADGATPRDVRARLGLDSGYLSRMIRALQRDGLVEERPDPADGRSKRLVLTRAGEAEKAELDRLSDELAASVLTPLTAEQRDRLLGAQAEVRRMLAVSMTAIEPEEPSSADARWCLNHYYAELAERFDDGFDPTRDLPGGSESPSASVLLLARVNGQPAACGVVRTIGPGIAEIKRMWVDRPHRGLGLGLRMLHALEEQAAELGATTVRLDTNRVLTGAVAMYRTHGYSDIPRYNDNPYAHHWFEKRLDQAQAA